jgi:hypothetical protein
MSRKFLHVDLLVELMRYEFEVEKLKEQLGKIGVTFPDKISYKEVIQLVSYDRVSEIKVVTMILALEKIFEQFQKDLKHLVGNECNKLNVYSPIFLLEEYYQCEFAFDNWLEIKSIEPLPVEGFLRLLKNEMTGTEYHQWISEIEKENAI